MLETSSKYDIISKYKWITYINVNNISWYFLIFN